MTFREMILSIDVSSIRREIAFETIKNCKIKDFEDYHAALAWEKLRRKFNSISAPSLVKKRACSGRVSFMKMNMRKFGSIIRKIFELSWRPWLQSQRMTSFDAIFKQFNQ
jgi:hypothetical protein